jgi:hypothetical protein
MRCAAVAKQLLRHVPPWRHRERARKVMVVWTRGDNSVENRPLVGSRRICFDRGDGRCVCDVQRSSVVSTTHTRCHLEQRLVFAIRICSHQLHQELGIRMLRGTGILDRSISVYDLAAQTARSHRRITQSSHGNPLDGTWEPRINGGVWESRRGENPLNSGKSRSQKAVLACDLSLT